MRPRALTFARVRPSLGLESERPCAGISRGRPFAHLRAAGRRSVVSQAVENQRTPEARVGMLSNASLPPPAGVSGHPATGPEDDLLLRALRDRDESAFVRVLDLYYSSMLRLAMTHVRSSATAEEVVQDTWLAALRGIDGFEGRSSVRTWLFRILRNIARTRGQRDARLHLFSDMQASPSPSDGSAPDALFSDALWMKRSPDPESLLTSRELRARIDAAIETLPPRQREVIVLRDIQEWTTDEVCNAMGITQTNQRVLLHRARERVRDALRPWIDDGTGDA